MASGEVRCREQTQQIVLIAGVAGGKGEGQYKPPTGTEYRWASGLCCPGWGKDAWLPGVLYWVEKKGTRLIVAK